MDLLVVRELNFQPANRSPSCADVEFSVINLGLVSYFDEYILFRVVIGWLQSKPQPCLDG
jgi:hypothetical protein